MPVSTVAFDLFYRDLAFGTGGPRRQRRLSDEFRQRDGCAAAGRAVTPESLEWVPRFAAERYHLSIYISENGLSCRDKIFLDGQVHDPQRIDFLARYLQARHKGRRTLVRLCRGQQRDQSFLKAEAERRSMRRHSLRNVRH